MNHLLCTTALLLIACTPVCTFAQQGKTQAEAKAQEYRPLLPENVERRNVTIWSDGTRMAGDLYLPKQIKPEDKLPTIVFIHGDWRNKEGWFFRPTGSCVRSTWIHFPEF